MLVLAGAMPREHARAVSFVNICHAMQQRSRNKLRPVGWAPQGPRDHVGFHDMRQARQADSVEFSSLNFAPELPVAVALRYEIQKWECNK